MKEKKYRTLSFFTTRMFFRVKSALNYFPQCTKLHKVAHRSRRLHVVRADRTPVAIITSPSPSRLVGSYSLSVSLAVTPLTPPTTTTTPPTPQTILFDAGAFFYSHSRSQSLWDGPVRSRLGAQRWRPQPEEPLRPWVQWNSKPLPLFAPFCFQSIGLLILENKVTKDAGEYSHSLVTVSVPQRRHRGV